MSLTTVDKAIVRHLRSLEVTKLESEGYIDGENTRVFSTPSNIDLATFPLTDKDLRFLPEGVYTVQDRKFYEIGSGTIPLKSQVVFGGSKFEIKSFSDRSFEGNFTKYFAKRITDDTPNNS